MPQVELDGRVVEVAEGSTLLDAATSLGVEVPTLCHDPRLVPSGACRMCLVSVTGQARPVPACATPAYDGAQVSTDTAEVLTERHAVLALLARSHPAGAAEEQPGLPFHRLLAAHGLTGLSDRPRAVDDSHPTIRVDMSQCIGCWRCVRICDEVQGQSVWKIEDRGHDSHVVPDSGGAFGDSSCVACGACVDTCPTGALTDRSVLDVGEPTAWTRSTCPYCGVGCELLLGTRDNAVLQVLPARDAPSNLGHLCVKGRYGYGFNASPDRVLRPRVRRAGGWQETDWETAVATVASAFQRALDEHGPSAVGVLGSARATNEENYLVQKLARVALGTNNVDCCARVCHAPSAAALGAMLGTGAATSSYDDIERARTILVCGSNTTENHPVVGARIRQAALRGTTLIVIDPRAIELTAHAAVHLRPRPGTNVLVLNALASVVVQEGLLDSSFLERRVEGLAELARFLADYQPEEVAAECGVPAAEIRRAARLYAAGGPALTFWGLGVTEQEQGVDGVSCLVNLALLTGNVGAPGTGVNPLRGQNNVQGSAHMGCEPTRLPGYAPLEENRERVGAVWGVPVPTVPGLDAMQMLDAAETGELKALWVVGWDLLLTQPHRSATERALSRLDTLVVQDLFVNETARAHATVLLPAASAYEKDGTFMSSERRVQRVRKAVEPPGEALPDWRIVCLVADALGFGAQFAYRDVSEIWDEVRRVWLPGAGMAWERLDAPGGLQWPCPTEDHPGTALLHTSSFPVGEHVSLRRVPFRPSASEVSPAFPFTLVTGRGLHQFNAGTMTHRSLTELFHPHDELEICAADAAAAGLDTGARVRVTSAHGSAVLPVRITPRVPEGVLFATFSDPSVSINDVTGPHRDPVTHTPAYKVTAVRLAEP